MLARGARDLKNIGVNFRTNQRNIKSLKDSFVRFQPSQFYLQEESLQRILGRLEKALQIKGPCVSKVKNALRL